MKRSDFADMSCSIAQTLNIVGEWWSWLIIRDIRLGLNRHSLLQKNLGISKKVLGDRLATLTEHGIIEAIDPDNSRKGYRLCEKGLELQPIIRTMITWGDKWAYDGDGPVKFIHDDCQKACQVTLTCDQCGGEIHQDNCKVSLNSELSKKMEGLNPVA
ncbi:MAG: DNA-binding HxlR family transcriptional regulator [Flavobacteriales bacterium]|jgi:DNA-binding HxlR family transcriptional regulator